MRGNNSQEAVEAFGELEDLKDKLQAAERACTAAEAQLHSMPPQREDSGDLAATVQALCTDLKVTLLETSSILCLFIFNMFSASSVWNRLGSHARAQI